MQFEEPPRNRYRYQHQPTRQEHQPAPAPLPEEHPAQHTPKLRKRGIFFGRRWLMVAVVIILLLGLGGLTYGYIHTRNQLEQLSNPKAVGQTQTQQIINHINKIVQLPTGETPTLATVSDVSKLSGQAFFKNAKNGDQVLIYTKAGVAILYRPSTQKVIEYEPVNLGNASQ